MSVMKTGCTDTEYAVYNDVEYDNGYNYFVMIMVLIIMSRFLIAIY